MTKRMNRRTFVVGAAAGAAVAMLWPHKRDPLLDLAQGAAMTGRAFSDDSIWNTPLPADVPLFDGTINGTHYDSPALVGELKKFGTPANVGLSLSAAWAMPWYESTSSNPIYTITVGKRTVKVHIPKGATPQTGSDAAFTVHDSTLGITVGLWQAKYANKKWTANGFDVYYDASNGLEASAAGSNEPRNDGHRGFPSAISCVRRSEIDAGSIDHVFKVGIDDTNGSMHYWPGVGHESRTGVIPEGSRFRINPSVDLSTKGLNSAAQVIATALQSYGVIVGDTGSSPCSLKCERDGNWSQVGLTSSSLSSLVWDDFEFVAAEWSKP